MLPMKEYWIAGRLQSGDRIERPGPFTPRQKRRTILVVGAIVVVAALRSLFG